MSKTIINIYTTENIKVEIKKQLTGFFFAIYSSQITISNLVILPLVYMNLERHPKWFEVSQIINNYQEKHIEMQE